jgi:hypothetical protein
MFNNKSGRSYFGRIAKLALVTMVILVALSFQASACSNIVIGDFVWNDLDVDGIQDNGEPGLEDVKVELYVWNWCSNEWVKYSDTTTDANGKYSFSANPYYYYYLKFELPNGFAFSPQDRGEDHYVDSDADIITGMTKWRQICVDSTWWDAGMYQKPAGLGNYVWNDINKNGVQDENEPGIPGVEVQLFDANGVEVQSTTTDSTGFYEFTGLAPGEYSLKFIKPTGYAFSPIGQGSSAIDSDADQQTGSTAKITLAAGEYNNEIDAGLFSASNEEIPEFPTVVLPMVAILGFAFIFQRRKE